jgi:tellurite resistance-related uncharacterized protein
MKMKSLPKSLKFDSKTPVFDETTVPKGLLKDHRTMAGYWGRIVVLEGEVDYVIQANPEEVVRLDHNQAGIVEPQVYHYVRPLGQVKFYVEFYK